MSSKKRGEFDVMKLLGGAALVLIILIVMFLLFGSFFKGVFNLQKCTDNGGQCRASTLGGGCGTDAYQVSYAGCDAGQVCCKPYEQTTGALQVFTAAQQTALQNAIIFTVNKSNPINDRATVDLKVDTSYVFHLSINDKLMKDSSAMANLGPCAVYVINSKEPGTKYLLTKDGSLVASDSSIDFTNEMTACDNTNFKLKYYKPSLLDAYKELTMYVILLDKEFNDTLKTAQINFVGPLQSTDSMSIARANLTDMYSNTQHWVAMRAYKLNIIPTVQFIGISGIWVTKNQISITCGATCQKVGLKLVRSDKQNYSELLNQCTNPAADSDFKYTLDYVSGTTLKTTGIPLNINIGGFRLPSQQKVMYLTTSKDIKVTPVDKTKAKADVLIDKATMMKTFYNGDDKMLVGENTYLCAKATSADGSVAYGLSLQPLKVDILPPYLNQDDIQVIYPDPVTATDKNTPYYYRQYPRIVLPSCYDYGQSGCANYDYYIHTGNFINLRSNTADWETGVIGLLVTQGLNSLMTYFAGQDAVNTICPFITSTDYIRNTNQEIRFVDQGQGIICIRVSDKVGNSAIVWKALWTPEEMFKKIVANQTQELVNDFGSS